MGAEMLSWVVPFDVLRPIVVRASLKSSPYPPALVPPQNCTILANCAWDVWGTLELIQASTVISPLMRSEAGVGLPRITKSSDPSKFRLPPTLPGAAVRAPEEVPSLGLGFEVASCICGA